MINKQDPTSHHFKKLCLLDKISIIFTKDFWKGKYKPDDGNRKVYQDYLKTNNDDSVEEFFWLFNHQKKWVGISLEGLFKNNNGNMMEFTNLFLDEIQHLINKFGHKHYLVLSHQNSLDIISNADDQSKLEKTWNNIYENHRKYLEFDNIADYFRSSQYEIIVIYQTMVNPKSMHSQLLLIKLQKNDENEMDIDATIDTNFKTKKGLQTSKSQSRKFLMKLVYGLETYYGIQFQSLKNLKLKIQQWDEKQKGPNCVTTTTLKLLRKIWVLKNNITENEYGLSYTQTEKWRKFISCHVQKVRSITFM